MICPTDVMGKARLADFGISRRLPKDQTTLRTGCAGTRCWMAKETLADEADIPYKSNTDIQVSFFCYTNLIGDLEKYFFNTNMFG